MISLETASPAVIAAVMAWEPRGLFFDQAKDNAVNETETQGVGFGARVWLYNMVIAHSTNSFYFLN
ncbi:unnamed protein product [Penicillium roqueforti FM164]|uniref:Genomic scaffold, ProqFM164S04 n=1 Tax=Penicillium roqueforti (strain FM164) TaxID=1365484 RepID=W6R0V7_PENRF|nr:unnamed protein product [Penicillium roqueforti FM164]